MFLLDNVGVLEGGDFKHAVHCWFDATLRVKLQRLVDGDALLYAYHITAIHTSKGQSFFLLFVIIIILGLSGLSWGCQVSPIKPTTHSYKFINNKN